MGKHDRSQRGFDAWVLKVQGLQRRLGIYYYEDMKKVTT